jgi:hypothetical protein
MPRDPGESSVPAATLCVLWGIIALGMIAWAGLGYLLFSAFASA